MQTTSVMLSHVKPNGRPRSGNDDSEEIKEDLEDYFGSAECESDEEFDSRDRETSSEEGKEGTFNFLKVFTKESLACFALPFYRELRF